MTDEQIDALLEPILRAAGTSLRHYSMQKSKDDMRGALRAGLESALASTQSPTPAAASPRIPAPEAVAAFDDYFKGLPGTYRITDELERVCKAADGGAGGWVTTARIRETLAAASEPRAPVLTDEQVRAGFRSYDDGVRGARNQTPWQIWRDAILWATAQAAAPTATTPTKDTK